MFCEKCGEKCNDGARFCPECGNKVNSLKDYNDTSYYKSNIYPPEPNKPPVALSIDNPIRILSLLLKIESILNILVAVIFVFGFFYNEFYKDNNTEYNNFYNSFYETSNSNGLQIVRFLQNIIDDYYLRLFVVASFWLLLLIIISIFNFYNFRKSLTYSRYILSKPVDIVEHYKKKGFLKEVILTIISFIFMGHYAVMVILPFIVKLIQKSYVLNNVKVFDEIEKNYLENQNSEGD